MFTQKSRTRTFVVAFLVAAQRWRPSGRLSKGKQRNGFPLVIIPRYKENGNGCPSAERRTGRKRTSLSSMGAFEMAANYVVPIP